MKFEMSGSVNEIGQRKSLPETQPDYLLLGNCECELFLNHHFNHQFESSLALYRRVYCVKDYIRLLGSDW